MSDWPKLEDSSLQLAESYTLDELEAALLAAGRNAGPAMLFDWWWDRQITEDQLRALILDAWSGAEWPVQAVDEETWLDWFYELGFVSDNGQPHPTEPITVWRGASIASGPRGFSWTPDVEKARWVANREVLFGHGPAGVYEAVVPPVRVLALIETMRPGEPEAIVDPTFFDLEPEQFAERGIPAPRLVETIERKED